MRVQLSVYYIIGKAVNFFAAKKWENCGKIGRIHSQSAVSVV